MTAVAPAAPKALARAAELVAPALDAVVERLDPSLHEPVRHHLAGGGKRVRAGLVLLAASAVGGCEEDGLVGAVAVELVHNYSLLHDDIMDGDRERRHRPTVWALYGVGPAIIAGDALAALATQVLLDLGTPVGVAAAKVLTDANQAMIAGQARDMDFERRGSVSVEECLAMERGKTGALLSASCALGAILGGGSGAAVAALSAYGEHLGIAFQAVDDLLGIWGDPSSTGKPVGSDVVARKKALPLSAALAAGGSAADRLSALLDPARALSEADVATATALIESTGARELVTGIAEEHLSLALEAIEQVPLADDPHHELVAVARYVTARDR